jgi:hypothetical protein
VYEPSPVTLSVYLSDCIISADVGAAPVARRPNVQMPDEYLPPNKILFLQNLPETVTKDQLNALFTQYPNLHEVRLVPSKKDIAFVEYLDEESATVAKDALHNYKLDGENKIKVRSPIQPLRPTISIPFTRSLLPGSDIVGSGIGTSNPGVLTIIFGGSLPDVSRMLVIQMVILSALLGFGVQKGSIVDSVESSDSSLCHAGQ